MRVDIRPWEVETIRAMDIAWLECATRKTRPATLAEPEKAMSPDGIRDVFRSMGAVKKRQPKTEPKE